MPNMPRSQVLTLVRTASVVLVLLAIAVQAIELANHGAFDATRFFAYFTIQSNLIGVAAFAWLVANRRVPRSRGLELLRGAAAVYLTITFVVVILLLSNVDVGLQLGWVDFVLHKLFPVIVVLDWIVDPPNIRLTGRDGLIWLIYPLIWTGLTLVRGAGDGWYPYPFLDPAHGGGYGQVAVTVAVVTVAFVVIAMVMIAIGNWRRGQAGDPQLPA